MDTYLSAVRCPDKDGYLLPTEPLERGSAWKCDRCGKLEASERVEKTMKEIKELGENINILAPLDVSHFSWDVSNCLFIEKFENAFQFC